MPEKKSLRSQIPEDRRGKIRLFWILLLVAFVAFGFRLLLHFESANSALTYAALPFAVGMLLLFFTQRSKNTKWYFRYWNLVRDAMIVMLSSSIVLFEGFICVLMFIPIYLFFVTLSYLVVAATEDSDNGKLVLALPAFIFLSALEGTTQALSTETFNVVEVSREIDLSIDSIKSNLTQPRSYASPARGVMSLFPPPILFDAPTLTVNEIHRVTYRYHRWFFTNTHEGSLTVRLKTVEDRLIETEVLEDTSYLSTYLKLHRTKMEFTRLSQDRTQVNLRIEFDRLLHPGWYFEPLERYGVRIMGESILTQLVAGENE